MSLVRWNAVLILVGTEQVVPICYRTIGEDPDAAWTGAHFSI